jgi:hypothetical protein
VSFVLPFRFLLYLSSLLRAVVFILRSRFFSCTSGPRAKGFFFPRSALGVLLSLVRSIRMLLDFSLASCSARIQRLLGSSAWLRFPVMLAPWSPSCASVFAARARFPPVFTRYPAQAAQISFPDRSSLLQSVSVLPPFFDSRCLPPLSWAGGCPPGPGRLVPQVVFSPPISFRYCGRIYFSFFGLRFPPAIYFCSARPVRLISSPQSSTPARSDFRLDFFFREPERAEGDSYLDLVLSALVLRFPASVLCDRFSSSCVCRISLRGTVVRFPLSSLRASAVMLVWVFIIASWVIRDEIHVRSWEACLI